MEEMIGALRTYSSVVMSAASLSGVRVLLVALAADGRSAVAAPAVRSNLVALIVMSGIAANGLLSSGTPRLKPGSEQEVNWSPLGGAGDAGTRRKGGGDDLLSHEGGNVVRLHVYMGHFVRYLDGWRNSA